MARIRTIKPEFWTSEQVAECSPIARLLFVGMWNFADDGGVHPASYKRLRMEVFPGDSFSDAQIRDLVNELKSARLIFEYTSQGQSYWHITGWKHQKIDKPNVKYPTPTKQQFDEWSTNGSRMVDDHSPPESSLRESSLREIKGEKEVRDVVAPMSPDGDSPPVEVSPNSHPTPEPARPPKAEPEITIPPALDTPEFHDAWKLWKKHRTEIRKPLKPTQQASQINLCVEWGLERSLAALKHTMAMGWQGLREPDATTVAKNSEFQF